MVHLSVIDVMLRAGVRRKEMQYRPHGVSFFRGGFTLVEIMVAAGVFAILAAIAMGGLAYGIKSQRRAQQIIMANTEVSSVLEYMAREMRTGKNFRYPPTPLESPPLAPQPYSQIQFENSDGRVVTYFWDDINGLIKRDEVASNATPGSHTLPLTSDKVTVRHLSFTLIPGHPNYDEPVEFPQMYPHRVAITVTFSPAPLGTKDPILQNKEVTLQTTVSPRPEITTGAGCFGKEGVVMLKNDSQASTISKFSPYGVAVDKENVYVVGAMITGERRKFDWRIEKRNKRDGMLDPNFGVGGVAQVNFSSEEARAIAIDPQYMYVVGRNDSQPLTRIEKRDLATGAPDINFGIGDGFGVGGVVTGPPETFDLRRIAADPLHDALFVVGYEDTLSAGVARLEKRRLSTGMLDTNWDQDGVSYDGYDTTDFDGVQRLKNTWYLDVEVAGAWVYAVGWTNRKWAPAVGGYIGDWIITKRSVTEGKADPNFGPNGNGQLILGGQRNWARGIAVDGGAIYIVGTEYSPLEGNRWRLEKRDASTGLLCDTVHPCNGSPFSTDGVITGLWNKGDQTAATDVLVAGQYVYVLIREFDSSTLHNWLVMRFNKNTGVADAFWGGNGKSVYPGGDYPHRFATDGANLYVVGSKVGGRYAFIRINLATGSKTGEYIAPSLGTAFDVTVANGKIYVATEEKGRWRTEQHLPNMDLGTDFGGNGVVLSSTATRNNKSLAVVGTTIVIAGTDDTPNWRIEKRNIADGSLASGSKGVQMGSIPSHGGFDVGIGGDVMYVLEKPESVTNKNAIIEERYLDDGSLGSGFPDGIVEMAANEDPNALVVSPGREIYIVGRNSNNNSFLVKKLESAGYAAVGFGSNGVADSPPPSRGAARAYDVVTDGQYVYVVGRVRRTIRRNGPRGRPIFGYVYDWRIEKYRGDTGEICTAAACGVEFGVGGVVQLKKGGVARAIAIDGKYMYVVGGLGEYEALNRAGSQGWRIEKRRLDTGELCTVASCGENFGDNGAIIEKPGGAVRAEARGIAIDDKFMYVVGSYGNDWRIEKRWLSDGTLVCE